MAKINLIIDKRINREGKAHISLSISHKSKTAYLSLGIAVKPSEWNGQMITRADLITLNLNNQIQHYLLEAQKIKFELEETGLLHNYTATEIKEKIKNKLFPTRELPIRNNFAATLRRFADLHRETTKKMYHFTLKRMSDHDPKIETRPFDQINYEYLTQFDAYLSQTSDSQNYRNIHLRNIRAVFNFALDEQITTVYPFRRYKIRPVPTPKRSLTIDQLRQLFNYPVEDYARIHLDMFKLMFLLCGINAADLYNLRTIEGDYITYNRAKTGKLYTVRVEPEALEIIDRYRGKNQLLNILDNYKNYRDYLRRQNLALRRIGPFQRRGLGGKKHITPAFPGLSTYWARHTWATLAAEIDIPDTLISQALGHTPTNTTTEIYIRRNQRKVDQANRRLIDYVLYNRDYRDPHTIW